MQTTPTNKKGLSAANAQAPMQTEFDSLASSPVLQLNFATPASVTLRHRRKFQALLDGPKSREDVDKIAGASNGPDEVMRLLRRSVMKIPYARKKGFDLDRHPVKFDVYSLTPADRIAARKPAKVSEQVMTTQHQELKALLELAASGWRADALIVRTMGGRIKFGPQEAELVAEVMLEAAQAIGDLLSRVDPNPQIQGA